MATTAPLPADVPAVIEENIFDVINAAITAHPRSQQKRIGPSEVGIACDRCLGHKLHGTPESDRGPAWKPAVGTACHAQIEEWFLNDPNPENAGRWMCETRVSVGEIDGIDIMGSCDLYDEFFGLVGDWKIVSPKQLTKYRTQGPSQQYRVQAHLYARGFQRLGMDARHVAIIFLPRDGELKLAHFWHEPYDESIAVAALERADRLAVNIRAMASIGEDKALEFINSRPVDPECYSCPRFPGMPTRPVAESSAALLSL